MSSDEQPKTQDTAPTEAPAPTNVPAPAPKKPNLEERLDAIDSRLSKIESGVENFAKAEVKKLEPSAEKPAATEGQ